MMQLSQSRFQREASINRSPQIGIKLAGYKCTHQSLRSFKSLLMPAPNLFLVHSFSYVEWDSKSYPFESLIFWGNWECKCFKIKWDCWYYLIHFPDKWENVLRCTQRVRNQRAPILPSRDFFKWEFDGVMKVFTFGEAANDPFIVC